MNKIRLYGSLAKFGSEHDLEVMTAGEAIVALCTIYPEFSKALRQGSWVLMRGDPETGLSLDEELVKDMRLGTAELHIIPSISGAKNGNGLAKIILGAALVAVSFGSAAFLATPISSTLMGATTWGNAIGSMGLTMTILGVSQFLTPEQESESVDDKSFTFTGPVSRQGQGHALQLAYGEVITGAMVISAGLNANGLNSAIETAVQPSTLPAS